MVETQFSKKVKTIRSDNGMEFFMRDFFAKQGICHQLSCVETPQQNGVVERKHQHILNVARALMFQSHLPLHLWGHAVLAAVYLINRTPSSVLSNQTPFEILFGHPPTCSHLRVFGCLCFASTLSNHRTKFAPRAKKCVFLGYPFGVKGYKVLDLATQSVFLSRDVIFHEHSFPFASVSNSVPDSFTSCDDVVAPSSSVGNDFFVTPISFPDFVPNDIDNASFPSSISTDPILDNAITSSFMSTAVSPIPSKVLSPTAPSSSPLVVPASPVPLRKSARDTRPPAYLQDYACTTFAPGAAYDLAKCITYSHLDPGYQSYLMTVGSSPQEPQSFSQAVQDPLWRATMDKEIQALENNHTWDVTTLPPDKLPIGCKWVYKVKFNPDGSVEGIKQGWWLKVIPKEKDLIF